MDASEAVCRTELVPNTKEEATVENHDVHDQQALDRLDWEGGARNAALMEEANDARRRVEARADDERRLELRLLAWQGD